MRNASAASKFLKKKKDGGRLIREEGAAVVLAERVHGGPTDIGVNLCRSA
jgi:hypothetical protein